LWTPGEGQEPLFPSSGPHDTREECEAECNPPPPWYCYWPDGDQTKAICRQSSAPGGVWEGLDPQSGPYGTESECCEACGCVPPSSGSGGAWYCYWPNGEETKAVCRQPNESGDRWDGNTPVSGPYDTAAECCEVCGCAPPSSDGSSSGPPGSGSFGPGEWLEVVTDVSCEDGQLVVTKTKIWARVWQGT
jgi:hypothetical protein